MQENISVLIATILAVVIIVLFPIYNIATRQDSMANNIVVEATTNFVDEVRNKGYVSTSDYQEYENKLNKTGNRYEIKMEIYKPILLEASDSTEDNKRYEEEYEIKYTDEILDELNGNKEGRPDGENISYLDIDYKFYVRVKNTNRTQAQILLGKLFGGVTEERIVVNYGGLVYANEWKKGTDSEIANSNIFISRPLNDKLEEYKYEHIADVYDELTGETNSVYGIRVALNDEDVENNSGVIKFILTYKDIEEFEDSLGNKLGTGMTEEEIAARRNHIEEYISLINFEATSVKVVGEIEYRKNDRGLYDAQYVIEIRDIQYDYENNPYMHGKVRIEAGSARSKGGEIGQLNSKEFVVIYNLNRPVINSFTSSPINVAQKKIMLTDGAGVKTKTLNFTANVSIYSPVAKIKEIKFTIRNENTGEEEIIRKAVDGANVTENFEYEFKIAKYLVKVTAIDTRNHITEKTLEFEVRERVRKTEEYTFNFPRYTYGSIFTIETNEYDGYKIISYEYKVDLPNHTPTYKDWYNIVDVSSGREENIIVPEALPENVDYTKTWVKQGYERNLTKTGGYWDYDYDTYRSLYYFSFLPVTEENSKYNFEDHYYIQNYNGDIIIPQDTERAIGTKNARVNILGDLSEKNITKLTFNYRMDPSHDFPFEKVNDNSFRSYDGWHRRVCGSVTISGPSYCRDVYESGSTTSKTLFPNGLFYTTTEVDRYEWTWYSKCLYGYSWSKYIEYPSISVTVTFENSAE